MNPSLRRLLFALFLTLPGALLTVAGAAGAVCSVIALTLEPDSPDNFRFFAYLVGSALVFGMGSCMGCLAEMLEPVERPWKVKSPRMVFTRIGLMVLALLCGCTAIAALGYLEHRMWLAALSAFIAGALLFLTMLAIQCSWSFPSSKKGADQS